VLCCAVLQDYVFCKVCESVDVDVGGGHVSTLVEGGVHVLQYACIRGEVFAEKLHLI
jgi:hypothetical protein